MFFKKTIFLSLFYCFSISLFAQTWNELNKEGIALFNKGEFEKAIPIAIKAQAAAEKQFGKINQKEPFYATALSNLGYLYFKIGDYPHAIPYYEELIAMWNKVFVPASAEYMKNCDILSYIYAETKDYEKAEPLQIETNYVIKLLYGDTSLKYLNNLNDLAFLYQEMNEDEKLITIRTELMELNNRKFGDYSLECVAEMRKLAKLYVKGGDFVNAEPLLLKIIEIDKIVLGENEDYAIDLNYLAIRYFNQGEYTKSEKLYVQSLEINKTLGYKSACVASLGNLALLYVNMGQSEKAEPMFLEAIKIYNGLDKTERTDLNYPALLGNLATLYVRMGLSQKAEPLYLESLQIRKSKNGEDENYANGLFNLAGLYMNLGLNEKAEILYGQSLQLMKTLLGEKHLAYGKAINTVALFYKTLGRYVEAKAMFNESVEIISAALGVENVDYATALHNFALLYTDLKEYDQAEALYLQAAAIWKKTLGEDHPFYAQLENSLATLYSAKGDNKKAEALYLKNLEKRKRILGEQHPDYAISLNNLALLYWELEDFKKTEQLLSQSGKLDNQYLTDVADVLSENEKNQLLANHIILNEQRNSFLYTYPAATNAFYKDNFNFQLLLKSFSLSASQNILSLLRQSKDTAVQHIYLEWLQDKTLLAKEYSLPVAERTEDMESLKQEAEKLEKQLTRQSGKFQNLQASLKISMTDVQRTLATDEVAIEFVSFDLFNKKWTDSTLYGAYVLRKNDAVPVFVPICEEMQLQQLFDSAGTTATAMVNNFYRGVDLGNTNNSSFLGTALYKLIWEPLEPYLKGIKKVSYSPAGKLFSVAFQALPVDSNTVLMDKYELKQYTSTRQVALRTEEKQKSKPTGITLFGNASFTMDSLQLVKQKPVTEEKTTTSINTQTKRGGNNSSWSALPGTAEEVKKIKTLFDENKISTKTFVQTTASEENLKALSGNSPQVLHIATHGFFLPDPKKRKSEMNFGYENAYTLANDPLLRSGLILAGGNYAWSGKTPIESVEDGIATAYEISQLNLSNTELVVLSACETALGDVKGSEGVFGLQRAFKMAGVKKMIVSLWQVPDKETAELMTTFYTYWMKGKTIEESFAQAQADMRKRYSPFYWAAFVLVE